MPRLRSSKKNRTYIQYCQFVELSRQILAWILTLSRWLPKKKELKAESITIFRFYTLFFLSISWVLLILIKQILKHSVLFYKQQNPFAMLNCWIFAWHQTQRAWHQTSFAYATKSRLFNFGEFPFVEEWNRIPERYK